MKLRKIAIRNVFRNKTRSLLSGLAIGLTAAAFVFLFGLIEGMQQDMFYNITTYYTGEVRIRNEEYNKYEMVNPLHLNIKQYDEVIDIIKDVEGIALTSPRVSFPTAIYQEGENHNALGYGVDFSREEEYQELNRVLIEGEIPDKGEDKALIGRRLADDLGLSIGDSMTIMTQTQSFGINAITLEISGLLNYPIAQLNKMTFLAPIDRMQYFLRMDDAATEVLIKLDPGSVRKETAHKVSSILHSAGYHELAFQSLDSISQTYSMLLLARYIYYFIAFIFFLLASTVIINTMKMAIYERTKEIGTITALGMSSREVVRLFLLEALFISIIAAFLGTLLGVGITYPMSKIGIDFTQAMEGVDFEIDPVVRPVLTAGSTILVFIFAVLISALASIGPSRKAAKIEPIEALRI